MSRADGIDRARAGPATQVDDQEPPAFRAGRLVSRDQGIIENNLGRMGAWRIDTHHQTKLWESLEINGNRVRLSLPAHLAYLGPLQVLDLELTTVILTQWARYEADDRRRGIVFYSLRGLYRALGHSGQPNSEDLARLRESLHRLVYVTIERAWSDRAGGERRVEVRRIFSSADFEYQRRDPGTHGADMSGWVRIDAEVLEALAWRQWAYALDLVLLRSLPSPLAKRLYVFLACLRMFPVKGRGHALRPGDQVKEILPLGRELYENLGIFDTNPARIRQKLVSAGRAICAKDPIYRQISIEQKGRLTARHWVLEVGREYGRSKAPDLRAAERVSRPAIWPDEESTGGAMNTLTAEEEVERHVAWERAKADPRAAYANERWFAAAARGIDDPDAVAEGFAWRKYRSALVAMIETGIGPEPEPPEPLPSEISGRAGEISAVVGLRLVHGDIID
jgi:hypothetical protein